jgi:RND family efflux transporter MFP subunit
LRVVEIAVDEGERVRRGQVLLRFDTAVAAAQVTEAEAALVEAEAALQVVRSDHGHGTEPPRSGSIATQMVGQRPATARQAEARVLAARAHRDEATVRLAQTEVLAPADGVVVRRAVQLGAVPVEGQELFRIVRDGRLELDAKLPDLDLPALHDGQSVRVVHGDWEAQASVRAVAPTVAADTRLGLVHVTLPDAGKLRPGMFARAEIQLDPAVADAVPEAAIVYRDDRPAVFVKEPNDRVSLRYLATGARQGGFVQVVDGLREGELVVTSGAGFLSEGDRVAVVVAPALATR